MKTISAAREAAPKKKPARRSSKLPRKTETYRTIKFSLPDHGTLPIRMIVLPDHWKADAKRWKDMESRGWMIRTRSRLAMRYREWRADGGKVAKGRGPFGSLATDFIQKAIRDGLDAWERRAES